jgi:hypothetical protein
VFKNILERVKHVLQMPLHFFRASRRTREEEHIDMTDTFSHQQLKAEIVKKLEEKFGVTLMRRRSYFEHLASGRRFIIAVSKRYKDMPQDYWYGYNSNQQSHLVGGADSYFVLGFLDTGRAFAVPVAEMNKMARYMNTTKRGYVNHHVNIRLRGKRVFIYINDDCPEFDILHFEI